MNTDDTMLQMLLITLSINLLMFLGQMAILSVNPEAMSIYDCRDGPMAMYEAQGCTNTSNLILNDTDPGSYFPSTEASTSPDTGNIFTDLFTTASNWLLDSIPGLNYLMQVLSAPYNLLSLMHLPQQLVFGIGTIWYVFSLFVVVAFVLR